MAKKLKTANGKLHAVDGKPEKGGRSPKANHSQVIEEVVVKELKPFPGNPRNIPDDEYKLLVKGLREHGDCSIITIDDKNRIVGGNQRLKAIKELKWVKIQAKRLVGYTENELKAINLALNKISGNWNVELLDKMLAELATSDFDMELTGFPEIDIDDINPNETIPEKPISNKKDGNKYSLSFGFKSKSAWMGIIEWNGSKRGNGDKLFRILKKAKII